MTETAKTTYVVRHQPSYSTTWRVVGYFETAKDALAKYEALREACPPERVWVVELYSDQVTADSRLK